uniref:Uncharacterized protein n=1 Tax=Meloidogyne incognita TaxID=6306 RepID=A0A914N787_MELIC
QGYWHSVLAVMLQSCINIYTGYSSALCHVVVDYPAVINISWWMLAIFWLYRIRVATGLHI